MPLFFCPPETLPSGRCDRGQVTAVTAVLIGVLVFSLVATSDVTRVVGKRMAAQNAADASALAMTTWQARGLNLITYGNHVITVMLVVYIVKQVVSGIATWGILPAIQLALEGFPPTYIKAVWVAQGTIAAYFPVIGLWRVAGRQALRHALVVEGARRVRDWAGRARLATVSWPAEPFDPFFNVNTADDLAEAERIAAIEDRA